MPKRRGGWNEYSDYYEPSKPRPVVGGIKARSERGVIGESWWSKRWVEVLESFDLGSRLSRGRSYARKGQVVSLAVERGEVKAKVQGSRPTPYNVKIRLTPFTDLDWDKVTDAMAAQAIFAAELLAGEMPQNIEEAFATARISLFPTDLDDLNTSCSCPDYANPCKHLAAVYYLLAERFDEDPFLIFKLRGRTKEEIIQTLREKRAGAVLEETTAEIAGEDTLPQSVETLSLPQESLENFWVMGEEIEEFRVKLELPPVNAAYLLRLGNPPVAPTGQDTTATFTGTYSKISAAAYLLAFEGKESHLGQVG